MFVFENFVKNGGLQGVVSRRKSSNKLDEAIEVFFLFLWIVADVDVISGSETFEVAVDEVGIVDELGLEFEKFVVLGEEKIEMDGVRPKASGVLVPQVFNDPFWQIRNVGVNHLAEPMAKPVFVVAGRIQLPDAMRLHTRNRVVVEGTLEKRIVGNDLGVNFGRVGGFATFDPFGMIEVNVQLILDVFE